MANSVFFSLISDCALSVALFFLFLYVGRISRSLHGTVPGVRRTWSIRWARPPWTWPPKPCAIAAIQLPPC